MSQHVWLVDFDGKIENLALMRLATYHKAIGDTVTLKHGAAAPDLFSQPPDKIYISCLFRWHQQQALDYFANLPCAKEIGGTGVDIAKCLSVEVQACQPDYTLYGKQRALGFISRGCIRKCPWCVVPQKEGRLTRVASAQDIVGNYQEAVFLDNNFLALPDCTTDLRWLAQRQTKIDFNQGLDARLVTSEIATLLAACRWSVGPRFA